MANNAFNSLREFKLKSGKTGKYYSLAALEEAGLGKVSRLPVSLRVVLESVLRNCDGVRIGEDRVRELVPLIDRPGLRRNLPLREGANRFPCSQLLDSELIFVHFCVRGGQIRHQFHTQDNISFSIQRFTSAQLLVEVVGSAYSSTLYILIS